MIKLIHLGCNTLFICLLIIFIFAFCLFVHLRFRLFRKNACYSIFEPPPPSLVCVASSRVRCSHCPPPFAGWSRSRPCRPAGRWSTLQRGCDTLWTTILAPPPLKTLDRALSQGKHHTRYSLECLFWLHVKAGVHCERETHTHIQ